MERYVVAVNVVPGITEFDCSECGEPGILTCSIFKSIKYCSWQCQATNESAHKILCIEIKEIKVAVAMLSQALDHDRVFGLVKFDKIVFYNFLLVFRFYPYAKQREQLILALLVCGCTSNSKLAIELALEHTLDILHMSSGYAFHQPFCYTLNKEAANIKRTLFKYF